MTDTLNIDSLVRELVAATHELLAHLRDTTHGLPGAPRVVADRFTDRTLAANVRVAAAFRAKDSMARVQAISAGAVASLTEEEKKHVLERMPDSLLAKTLRGERP